jgi:hypothetical protein
MSEPVEQDRQADKLAIRKLRARNAALLQALKECVINLERVTEDGERHAKRSREKLEAFCDTDD